MSSATPASATSTLVGVYLPAGLFEVGIGAVTPVFVLSANHLAGNAAIASFVVSLLLIGQFLGDVPAGALATRFGDKRAMLMGVVASVAMLMVCVLATHWVMLAAGVLLLGAVNSVFLLARQSYLTEITPPLKRARALSTLGGVQRIGALVGPLIGAAFIHQWGLAGSYWFAIGISAATGAVLLCVRDVAPSRTGTRAVNPAPKISSWKILTGNKGLFATIGVAIFMVGAVRATRQIILPLWSQSIGLPDSTTSLIFGLSWLLDVVLFYPSGRVMDRMGRMWVAIPSMAILGLSIALLPLTHTLTQIAICALFMGLGNGIGAGILMTLGADIAPPEYRAKFLGVWRLFSDVGGAAGPLTVSAAAALGSLAVGISVAGSGGVIAAIMFAIWLPKFTIHANSRTRRAAGL